MSLVLGIVGLKGLCYNHERISNVMLEIKSQKKREYTKSTVVHVFSSYTMVIK